MEDNVLYRGSCFVPYYYSIQETLDHIQDKCKYILHFFYTILDENIEVRITKVHESLMPQERVVWYSVYQRK